MIINEIFCSIQGESRNVGLPSVFVRTQGCPVRCDFCDTPYTYDGSEKGTKYSIDGLFEQIQKYHPVRHVVLTGGEPMIQPDVEEFMQKLINNSYTVEVETAGVTKPPSIYGVQYNISPKLSCAGPKIKPDPELLVKWWRMHSHHGSEVYFKFVVADEKDWNEVKILLSQMKEVFAGDFEKCLYFMPEGKTEQEVKEHSLFIVDRILKEYPIARLTPRLHINLWGPRRAV